MSYQFKEYSTVFDKKMLCRENNISCHCDDAKYVDCHCTKNHTNNHNIDNNYCNLDCELRIEFFFRKLWSEHGVYTKFYINSVLGNIPDADLIAARLLRNQQDIGNFTKQFIGTNRGNALAELLKQHILAAAGAVNAVKSGNQTDINNAVAKVFQNSRKVSAF